MRRIGPAPECRPSSPFERGDGTACYPVSGRTRSPSVNLRFLADCTIDRPACGDPGERGPSIAVGVCLGLGRELVRGTVRPDGEPRPSLALPLGAVMTGARTAIVARSPAWVFRCPANDGVPSSVPWSSFIPVLCAATSAQSGNPCCSRADLAAPKPLASPSIFLTRR